MQQPGRRHVGGEAGRPRHDGGAGRRAEIAGAIRMDMAVDRIGDGAIAGTAAEVALQCGWQVGLLALVQRRRRHDHSGGAEAALEPLRVEEGLLHRVKAPPRRQVPRWS